MKKLALILSMLLLALPMVAGEERVAGPDGRLVVTVNDKGGAPAYGVTYDGVEFLAPSPLGLKTDVGDYTEGLTLTGVKIDAVSDDYSVPTIKASTVHYRANRGVFSFSKDGKPGPWCQKLYTALQQIQYGEAEDVFGWCDVINL